MSTANPPTRSDRRDAAFPYRFELVRIERLFIDETYQRPLTRLVKKIVDDFEPRLIGALFTSERADEALAVMDGQTRWAALKRLGFGEAPCLIYTDLSVADEAGLFIRWQKDRLANRPYHRFRAQVAAKDPASLEIQTTVELVGFELADNAGAAHTISAIGALEKVHGRNPEILLRTLTAIYTAWTVHRTPATTGDLIQGIGLFLARAEKDGMRIDDERLTRRLSVEDPKDLAIRASHLRQGKGHGGGSPLYMADVIASCYRRRAPVTA